MNTLITTILFFVCVLGVTNIINREYVFESLRTFILDKLPLLNKLITCSACTGFWVSVCLYLITPGMLPIIHECIYLSAFLVGAIGSFICKIVEVKLFTF